jgi:hypothetical protein
VACASGSSKAAHEANPNAGYPAERDPQATIAVSAAPVVLEGRYRLLMRALWQLRHSRRTRWGLGLGSGAVMLLLAFLAVRHFVTTSWPLSRGQPGLLVAAGLLLLLAQALKALGWARLFSNRERPSPLALVAGNGGAALIGVVLPGRFDDAMRIAVVRRYPGCPAGLRAISLSLVMLGLIDSAALTPRAAVAVAFPGAGVAARAALAVVAGAGIAAAAVIVALPRLAGSERALRSARRRAKEKARKQAGLLVTFCSKRRRRANSVDNEAPRAADRGRLGRASATKKKREARRFSRTAQKPFFSLLLTALQALAGACGRRWKSPLTIPLIAGYASGILSDSATPGPASNGGIRSVRAPPSGRDLARHTDSHPCRAHGAARASSQPEPRGQVLQLDFHRLGRGVSGPHVLVDRVHARHEAL